MFNKLNIGTITYIAETREYGYGVAGKRKFAISKKKLPDSAGVGDEVLVLTTPSHSSAGYSAAELYLIRDLDKTSDAYIYYGDKRPDEFIGFSLGKAEDGKDVVVPINVHDYDYVIDHEDETVLFVDGDAVRAEVVHCGGEHYALFIPELGKFVDYVDKYRDDVKLFNPDEMDC